MIKKIISIGLVFVMSFMVYNFSFADEINKNTLTLEQVRVLARQNAKSTEIYKELIDKYEKELALKEQGMGEKYIDTDSEGLETEKYRNGTLEFDYKTIIESYEDQIENFTDANEDKAINKYFEILTKQLEIEEKLYEKDLIDMDINIAKTKLENNMSLKIQLDEELQKKLAYEDELKSLNRDLELLFDELNYCIGKQNNEKYFLDKSTLIVKVKQFDTTLYVPSTSVELARKESNTIKDAMEKLVDNEKQLANYSKLYPKGTKEYEAKEKELEIEDMIDDIIKQKDSLYFDMESSYIDMITSFARLTLLNEDIEFNKYELEIDSVYYETGMISKREYMQRKIDKTSIEQDYLISMLETYHVILGYERSYKINQ